jgi:hypothetical protein
MSCSGLKSTWQPPDSMEKLKKQQGQTCGGLPLHRYIQFILHDFFHDRYGAPNG